MRKACRMIRSASATDPLTQLGHNLRRLRGEAGFSQESFALHAGINRGYIGDVERGQRNVSLRNLVKISRALGIPLDELLRDVR